MRQNVLNSVPEHFTLMFSVLFIFQIVEMRHTKQATHLKKKTKKQTK